MSNNCNREMFHPLICSLEVYDIKGGTILNCSWTFQSDGQILILFNAGINSETME